MLGNLSVSTPGTVGDVYLTPDYRIATFWLYADNQVAQGFAARLDLQRNEFDIHMGKGNGIKAMPGTKVRTMPPGTTVCSARSWRSASTADEAYQMSKAQKRRTTRMRF